MLSLVGSQKVGVCGRDEVVEGNNFIKNSRICQVGDLETVSLLQQAKFENVLFFLGNGLTYHSEVQHLRIRGTMERV